jgi:hypothetical protein
MFTLRGRLVAGIGLLPNETQPGVWSTDVAVDDADPTVRRSPSPAVGSRCLCSTSWTPGGWPSCDRPRRREFRDLLGKAAASSRWSTGGRRFPSTWMAYFAAAAAESTARARELGGTVHVGPVDAAGAVGSR